MQIRTFDRWGGRAPIIITGTLLLMSLGNAAQAQTQVHSDLLLDTLIRKGYLTQDEARNIEAGVAAQETNATSQATAPAPAFKLPGSMESLQLYGDMRLRYEYRGTENAPGVNPDNFYRERFRYALRLGIRGDLFDQFNYGIRLETATNPRSPWATFGSNGTSGSVTPSDKSGSGVNIGQLFLGWHPESWFETTVGRMPMPLYTTPMVWDSDINPEGAFEKFKVSTGNVDWFADFGQFDYQDPGSSAAFPSTDVFVLAWQAGGVVKFNHGQSFKIAPVLYTYTGEGYGSASSPTGLNAPFVGQGKNGVNIGVPSASTYQAGYNEQGINDLLVLEIPAEFDFPIPHTALGDLQGRLFGDFAYNLDGSTRARAAYDANPAAFPGLSGPSYGRDKACQVGFGIGSAGPVYAPTQGLVYGSTSKKHTWEARFYWQRVEQYALDVNLMDSDFFEGRANLQGIYSAFAYSFTDSIIGTVRYGYAGRIDGKLGTGGNNLDIPGINPIQDYNLFQVDLTWRL